MAITTDDEFVSKMIDILGLPKRGTKSFELRCAIDELVTVKAEYYPDPKSADTITERFKLEKV